MGEQLTPEEYEAVQMVADVVVPVYGVCSPAIANALMITRSMLERRKPQPCVKDLALAFLNDPCLVNRRPLWEAIARERGYEPGDDWIFYVDDPLGAGTGSRGRLCLTAVDDRESLGPRRYPITIS